MCARLRSALLTISLLAVGAATAYGQSTTFGQFLGTVTDLSGAVVPGASVTAVNRDTNVARTTVTNERGDYVVDKLIPGVYDLRAELSGFKTEVAAEVRLLSSQKARVDFLLTPGAASETVSVTDHSVILDTATAERASTIEEKQITGVPLAGRSLTVLSELTTGAVGVRFSTDTRFFRDGGGMPATNGLRPDQSSSALYDGANNQDYYDNKASVKATPETVQEFKIITNTVSAEYGKVGGMVVSAVSKSGTNEFHGSAWEYIRNERFNANGLFANRAGLGKLPLSEHNFGGALGGPIIKNKTFFFGSYEGFRNSSAVPGVMDTPSLAERQGDFSKGDGPWGMQTIYDPFEVVNGVRVPFAGNRIPDSRINATSKRVLDLIPYPQPNQPANPNYSYRHETERNQTKFSGRVDHHFADQSTLFGRFTYMHDPTLTHGTPGSCNPCPIGVTGSFVGRGSVGIPGMASGVYQTRLLQDNGWQAAAGWVRPFGARIVNELNFGTWYWKGGQFTDDTQNWVKDFGFDLADKVVLTAPDGGRGPAGLPSLGISGYASVVGATDLSQYSKGFSIKETLSWSQGAHYFKFGFEHLRYYNTKLRNIPQGSSSDSFDGYNTGQITRDASGNVNGATFGQPFADFLLGTVATASGNIQGGGGFGTGTIGGMDVLSFYNVFINDDWKISQNVTLNLGLRWEIPLPPTWLFDNALCYFDVSGGRNNPLEIVPKGFPIDAPFITGGDHSVSVIPFVERSGRTCVPAHWADFAPRLGLAWRMFGDNRTVLRIGAGLSFDGVMGSFQVNEGDVGRFVGSVTARQTRGTTPLYFIGLFNNLPTVAQFRVQPVNNYLRSASPDQSGQIYNYNVSIQRELMRGTKLEVAYVGNTSRHMRNIRAWNVSMPAGYEVRLNTGETLVVSGTQEQRRPYPLVGANIMTNFDGVGYYNSLQAKVDRRFQNGLAFSTGYTYGSVFLLNTQGLYFSAVQNEFDRGTVKGKPRWDRTNSYFATFMWQLPIFRNATGLKHTFLGGWETSSIITLASGAPFGVLVSRDIYDQGARHLLLPDRICDGNLPGSQRTVERFYDTSCFTLPQNGKLGNSAMLPLRGDNVAMVDFGIHKLFSMGEERALEFRADMFNALNTTVLDSPGGNAQDPIDGTSAGRVTSGSAPRQIQFSFRFMF